MPDAATDTFCEQDDRGARRSLLHTPMGWHVHSGKIKTLLQHLLHEQQHSTEVDKLMLIRDGLIHQHAAAILLQRL